jgi:hypothetical protein
LTFDGALVPRWVPCDGRSGGAALGLRRRTTEGARSRCLMTRGVMAGEKALPTRRGRKIDTRGQGKVPDPACRDTCGCGFRRCDNKPICRRLSCFARSKTCLRAPSTRYREALIERSDEKTRRCRGERTRAGLSLSSPRASSRARGKSTWRFNVHKPLQTVGCSCWGTRCYRFQGPRFNSRFLGSAWSQAARSSPRSCRSA